MIFKGVDGLIDATNETKNGLGKAHDLTTEAQGLIDDYADFQEQVDMLLKQFDEEFAEICPDACQVVSGGTECNLAGLPFAEDVSRILDSTGDYLTEQLGGVSTFRSSLGPRENGWRTHDTLSLFSSSTALQ